MVAGDSRRWWALSALSLSVLVVALDLFVLTLALPTVSADLHASSGDLQWFIDAYSLVLAAALLPAGLIGDWIGRKRLLLGALVLFGLASVACAYSRSSDELIAARAVLGLAAAVILPMSLAVLPVLFSPQERPRAIAAVGGATFLGYPIGPILGGYLLDHFWWGSVFLINVPVVLIAIAAVTTMMPESYGDARPRLDYTGIAISSAGLTSLTYGLIRAADNGWSNPAADVTMAAGVAALAAFFAWERRMARARERPAGALPLVDLELFSSAGFTWGTVLATLVSFALFGLVFAMPQYFRDIRALDSLATGLRMLPMIGGLAIGLAIGQRLQTPRKASQVPPVGQKILVAGGFAVMAAALAAGTGTSTTSGTGYAATWFAVAGFGLGLAMPTALNAALGALTPARSGSGSALITAMRQVGGTLGVAVLGTVLANVYQANLDLAGLPAAAVRTIRLGVAEGVTAARAAGSSTLLETVRNAYVHGMDVMLWVCAGIAIASALLALAFLPRRANPAEGQAAGATATAVADPSATAAPGPSATAAPRRADAVSLPDASKTSPRDESRMTT